MGISSSQTDTGKSVKQSNILILGGSTLATLCDQGLSVIVVKAKYR